MSRPALIDDCPVALSVAGSDCSAGAGLQADLKTFTAFGVYGLTALTCAVSETPARVSRIEALPPEFLADQVRLLLDAFPVRAIKTGMLYSSAHINALVDVLEESGYAGALVVDPVMVATSGAPLLEPDAVRAYESRLFPRASLLTPNMDEAGALLARPLAVPDDIECAAGDLQARFGVPVLVKGGHLRGDKAIDVLREREESPARFFESPVCRDVATHGTGCTLSAAIAAGLAHGQPLTEAIDRAKAFVSHAISHAFRWPWADGELHALNHTAIS